MDTTDTDLDQPAKPGLLQRMKDGTDSVRHSALAVFAGGAFMGAARGATLGGGLWLMLMAVGAIVPGAGAAALFAIAGTGAAVLGIYHGLADVAHDTAAHPPKKHRDRQRAEEAKELRVEHRQDRSEDIEEDRFNRYADREMERRAHRNRRPEGVEL
jgi:hypothetical protein